MCKNIVILNALFCYCATKSRDGVFTDGLSISSCVSHVLWTITPVFYVTSSCLILCLHTGPPFCQHGKYALQLLVKHATNCRIVMLLVAENDIAKTRNYDSGRNNCLRNGALDRNAIVMRKDEITRWSILNISVVVSLFLSIFLAYSPFLPEWRKILMKESLLLRLDLYWASSRQNLSSWVCEQQRRRPACASAQTDQRLCYSLTGKYHI